MPYSTATKSMARFPFFYVKDGVCYLAGDWSVLALAAPDQVDVRREALLRAAKEKRWDLTRLHRLDTIGAHLIWRTWGERIPDEIEMSMSQREVFDTLVLVNSSVVKPEAKRDSWAWLQAMGQAIFDALSHGRMLLVMLGQLVLDFFGMLRHPRKAPWREILAQIYRTGAQALGITALVGFLIGVVLSYLSAQQLQLIGADRFIVKLLGVSIARELGPVLAAILVAGRSGSTITAQIGVMRVTQELDAMSVMGISHSQRLILPRVLALSISMPLLVMWTGAMALMGGMLAANLQLSMSLEWFLRSLPEAITMTNYLIGMTKGVTFGILIALIACHFGLRIQPNTESLGFGTTTSVVTAITGVILLDAVFAIVCSTLRI